MPARDAPVVESRVMRHREMRLRSIAAVLLLGLVGAGCATASPERSASASGDPSARPPSVEVLGNGMTLIVQDHRAADIAAVYLWVNTGVRYETSQTLGHAH